jgi:hypothetical protein
MKAKRVWAVLLAATMVIGSTIGVSAATGDENNTGSETTVTGTGTVDYVDTTIYNVGLPTDAALNLTVDPQGLSILENDKTATADELAEAAGKITSTSVVAVTNAGSVPVKVSVAMSVTGNATVKTNKDDVNVESAEATNVLMYVVPSAVDTPDEAGYQAYDSGYVIKGAQETDATKIDFVLPAADYVFSKNEDGSEVKFVRDEESAVHGTALEFGGFVNKYADWSTYTSSGDTSATNTIGLKAVFTFTHTLTEADVATEGAPYAMIENSSLSTVEVGDGPKVSISDDGLITISGLTPEHNYQVFTLTYDGAAVDLTQAGTVGVSGWTQADGGTITYQLNTAWTSKLAGHTVVVTVTLTDGTTKIAKKTWD